MERFRKLTKQKASALKVFQQARTELSDVITKLGLATAEAHKTVELKTKEIQAEHEAIAFAAAEMASVEKQIQKIDGLLSP